MYADWASLQDEIKFDKANKSVLHKFPNLVGREVAGCVVKTLAQNLSISVSNPDPSNLESDKDVKWTMEVCKLRVSQYTDILVCSGIDFPIQYYRVIALISANIVPSLDIEGRELASVRRYPNEGQYSPISV